MDGWMDRWNDAAWYAACGIALDGGVEYVGRVGTPCTVWRYLSIYLGTCFT